MKTHRTWQLLTAVLLLAFLGLGMLGEWVMWLFQGYLTDGIYTVQNNTFIVMNIFADAVAALLVLVELWGSSLTGSGVVLLPSSVGVW